MVADFGREVVGMSARKEEERGRGCYEGVGEEDCEENMWVEEERREGEGSGSVREREGEGRKGGSDTTEGRRTHQD